MWYVFVLSIIALVIAVIVLSMRNKRGIDYMLGIGLLIIGIGLVVIFTQQIMRGTPANLQANQIYTVVSCVADSSLVNSGYFLLLKTPSNEIKFFKSVEPTPPGIKTVKAIKMGDRFYFAQFP